MSLQTPRGECIYIVVGADAPTQMSKNNDKSYFSFIIYASISHKSLHPQGKCTHSMRWPGDLVGSACDAFANPQLTASAEHLAHLDPLQSHSRCSGTRHQWAMLVWRPCSPLIDDRRRHNNSDDVAYAKAFRGVHFSWGYIGSKSLKWGVRHIQLCSCIKKVRSTYERRIAWQK